MENREINLLKEQIQNIIESKPVLDEFVSNDSPEFQELEEMLAYLAHCLDESNEFLYSLCNGKLDSKVPGRYNFIAGNLKELHSILKYLTWQTTQVAHGDYQQRVRFLGEFSDAFNQMVKQLAEREISLNEKTKALSQSMDLLTSIMDTQEDGILVIDVNTQEVIYSNQVAKKHFYHPKSKQMHGESPCLLLAHLKAMSILEEEIQSEYYCEHTLRFFKITSLPVNWGGQKAFVHYVSDVSAEKEVTETLSALVYKDDLTGIYNRRYCIETLIELVENRENFSLAVLDLDGLKYVNDTFGHIAGDEYLRTVVGVINKDIEDTDIACRIGGDEFVIIFKNAEKEFPVPKIEKIYTDILQTEKEYPLSISYGITYVYGGEYHSAEEILRLTDAKMYEFKKKHR